MKCPHGNSDDLKVNETRETESNSFRRRRECNNCEERFTTYEKIQELLISVKKESGKLENYTKEKLEKSFLIACNKRPITRIQILKIIENIENKIRNNFKNEISSKTLGEYVMEELKILDPISYIRYASVYKDFDDLDKFNQELI